MSHEMSRVNSIGPSSTAEDPFSRENYNEKATGGASGPPRYKRTWYGKKYQVHDEESLGPEPRPTALYAPLYNGLAGGLSVCK